MGYRESFIKKYPGVKRMGKKGYWYKCASCGKWCGRPGSEGAYIRDDEKMEVDHIRPWAMGGSDAVWNLQAMCKPCNRDKSAGHSTKDSLKMIKNDIIHLDFLSAFLRRAYRQNKFLKWLGINKRN